MNAAVRQQGDEDICYNNNNMNNIEYCLESRSRVYLLASEYAPSHSTATAVLAVVKHIHSSSTAVHTAVPSFLPRRWEVAVAGHTTNDWVPPHSGLLFTEVN